MIEPNRRLGRHHDFVELFDNTLFRDNLNALGHLLDTAVGLLLDIELQLSGKPNGTHHPQRIILKSLEWINRCANKLFL